MNKALINSRILFKAPMGTSQEVLDKQSALYADIDKTLSLLNDELRTEEKNSIYSHLLDINTAAIALPNEPKQKALTKFDDCMTILSELRQIITMQHATA